MIGPHPATAPRAKRGEYKCEDCTFYHPERPKKMCSAFGNLENKRGDCSLYCEDKTPVEDRARWC